MRKVNEEVGSSENGGREAGKNRKSKREMIGGGEGRKGGRK